MFQLANKGALLLLIFIPALVFWMRFLKKKGKRYIIYSSEKITGTDSAPVKFFLIKNLKYFKLFPLVLMIIALARPRIVNYYDIENRSGIDILIALDISGSMASLDFQPKNRLEVAKEVIEKFINKRESDRIGLVVFAGAAVTKCPLTLDYDLLRTYLNETHIGDLEDGTALGMALATSVNRIKNSKSRSKLIILLTDGVNNRGEIDPEDAAKMAEEFKIKVYTIGVGTRGRAPFPFSDAVGNVRKILIDVEIDEKLLREIANNTGGLYFRATNKKSLRKIFSEIDKWEKTKIKTRRFSIGRDIFGYFLFPAFLIFLVIEILKRTLLAALP